jgi:hypothetical protein
LASFLTAGREVGQAAHVWVFLAPYVFRFEDPVFEPWISLDFLGFFRPNRDFSMGYAGFRGKNFSPAFLHGTATGAAVEAMRKRGIVHEASLPRLLIFCKQLSSEPSPSGRLDPKATCSNVEDGRSSTEDEI